MPRWSRRQRPDAPPTCTGGNTFLGKDGYVRELSYGHPRADKTGYVLQHILVAEKMLRRLLLRPEVVHHENHRRHDNDPTNLRVFPSQKAHLAFHRAEWAASGQHPSKADISEQSARTALLGRSTLEAAELLGVNHQTLRNRFPHLLTKRQSPGFLDARKEEIRTRSKTEPRRRLARSLGCSASCLGRTLRRWSESDGQPGEPATKRRRGPDQHPRSRTVYVEAWKRRKLAAGLPASGQGPRP